MRLMFLASLIILAEPSALPATGGGATGPAGSATVQAVPATDIGRPSQAILDALPSGLRALALEVLDRNPEVRELEARALAAAAQAPQARSLPDPMVGITAFPAPPETRVGPQRLMTTLSQAIPWKGKLAARERAARYHASALEARVEARRLALVTEARRLLHELSFQDRHATILVTLRQHLLQHEEVARARYSAGIGLGQAVVQLQASITGTENQLLAIAGRRIRLLAELNELRDRPPAAPVNAGSPSPPVPVPADLESLIGRALHARPELTAASAEVERTEVLLELARLGARPDFTIGLSYTFVERRQDAAGRLMPPPDNGDDILGVQAGITLPIRRRRIASAIEEAEALRTAAREARRRTESQIRRTVGDLAQRLPLAWQQLRLADDVLVVQAEESLASAQAAYVGGSLGALDLLTAEHVLWNAHTDVARNQADFLIALAQLEGAVGGPLLDSPAFAEAAQASRDDRPRSTRDE